MDLDAFERNYRPFDISDKRTPQKKKGGRGGFLTSLISEGGGLGGAVSGGATGAAIGSAVPVLGTAVGGILGAGIGGFLGGGGGRVVENIVRDDRLGVGDALKEGAMSGAFGAAGQGLTALRGARAASKVAKSGGEALQSTSERAGRKLLGDAWGIKAGTKTGGEVLTPQEALKLNRFVTGTVRVPKASTADQVLERTVNFKKSTGEAIGNLVKASDRPITPDEAGKLINNVSGKINKLPGIDYSNNTGAKTIFEQLKGINSLDDLHRFRVDLDDTINFSRNINAPDPILEKVSRAVRSEIDNFTSGAIKGLKPLQRSYGNASRVIDYVAPNAKNPRGLNILNNRIGGGLAQKGESLLGSSIGKMPSLSLPSAVRPIAGQAAAQAPGNLADAIMSTQPDSMPPPEAMSGGEDSSMAPEENMAASKSPYSLENALLDIQRDPKNADYYIKLHSFVNPKQTSQKPMGAEAQKRSLTAQSGLRSLSTLGRTLQSDPGAFKRQALPNPFGITAGLTGTSDVRAATDNVVDVIARLRSGAAITEDEAARFARQLPQPGDSQESARRKLLSVQAELESFVGPQADESSLEDVLMQYQGGF